MRLARRIQAEIKSLVDNGTLTGRVGDRRELRYGDVLVLVRRRGNVFDAVIQALKHGNIPVAGADRLKLTEHIAIIDLMNLADALLLPQDDLALAVALKSPLFGLDEDDLFKLAWQRKGSLRRALDHHAESDGKIAAALRRLRTCEARAAEVTPFAFYAWLLGGDGGRQRILKRLGHEANDALDEFLELALGYERKAPASLQGFMAWLRAADTEVKRDMEISRDEVRVMTVHGAKGLEASVVFLVDTTTSPTDTQRLRLIRVPNHKAPDAPGIVVWAGKKADDPAVVAAARVAMLDDTEDEYRRLLYVAMTRAADRLIIGGCRPGNVNSIRKCCWYDLIAQGLERSGMPVQQLETTAGTVKRYTRPEDATAPAGAAAASPAATAPTALPSWLRAEAAPETFAGNLLRPSDPVENVAARLRTGETARVAGARLAARYAGAPAAAVPARARHRTPPRRRDRISRPQRRWLDRARAHGPGAVCAWPDRGPPFRPGIRARQPRRGLDRRTAGAAGTGQSAGFRANRPAGGDPERGPDRRLQDQPRPAEAGGRGAFRLCPPARALPRGARQTLSPASGPRRPAMDRNT